MAQEIQDAADFSGYDEFLRDIKSQIQTAQTQAALSLSRKVTRLYWRIGRGILERQAAHGWGAKVVPRLAADLKAAFPGIEGFSARNLDYMKSFAEAYPDEGILQHLLQNSPLPWGHYTRLLDKVKGPETRLWYIHAAHEYGWSRNVLEMVSLTNTRASNLYGRQGKAISNFERALPPPQSDLAQQILEDPYNFDFLTLGPDAHEREIERGLLEHVRQFLLEMGAGFALVGSQYHLVVDEEDYYLDLLFYHLRLRCFVVVDLKARKFTPEDAGKMNFYLSAVDDLLRHPADGPTVGIVLCRTRKSVTVEYALRNTAAPIGVSSFVTASPENLALALPSVAYFENELARQGGNGDAADAVQ